MSNIREEQEKEWDVFEDHGKERDLFETGYFYSVLGDADDNIEIKHPEGLELLIEYEHKYSFWKVVLLQRNADKDKFHGFPVEAFCNGKSLGIHTIK